jgi:hypothetical protein
VNDQNPWSHLLVTVITVAGVAVIMWMEAPPWQREQIRLRLRLKLRSVTTRLAARSGHRAMGDELSGRTMEADAGYGFTYRLSRLRDKL